MRKIALIVLVACFFLAGCEVRPTAPCKCDIKNPCVCTTPSDKVN